MLESWLRITAGTSLAALAAPWVAGLMVVAHLAIDHHHHHEPAAEECLAASVHGHWHAADTEAHDHVLALPTLELRDVARRAVAGNLAMAHAVAIPSPASFAAAVALAAHGVGVGPPPGQRLSTVLRI